MSDNPNNNSVGFGNLLAGLHNTSGMLFMGPHIEESALMIPSEMPPGVAPAKDKGIGGV